MNHKVTIFCDIDGTLVHHKNPSITSTDTHKMSLLPGTLEKLIEWEKKGYYIVLTTARKESMRKVTQKQLSKVGIFYDQLIMGISSGGRYLINDDKPDGTKTSFAINLPRNKGLEDINI
jgi:hydroxymethylpyrimidine pyrophosphatase-like HAD family hydrolase